MAEKLRPRVNQKYNLSPECKKEVNSSGGQNGKINQKKLKNQDK